MGAWIGTVTDRDTTGKEISVFIPEIDFQTGMMPVVNCSDIPGVGDSVAVILSDSSDYDGIVLGTLVAKDKIILSSDMAITGKLVIDGDIEITGDITHEGNKSQTGDSEVKGGLNVRDDAVIDSISYSAHTHTGVNGETSGPH